MRYVGRCVCAILLRLPFGGVSLVEAQSPARLAATLTAEPVILDGRLEEAVWNLAEVASGFVQAEPLEGQPATDATEVRV